ncbi:MAG: Ig domain-containing protein [Thermoanaerobaculia bacterium]
MDDGFLTIAFDEAFRIQTLQEDIPPLHCGRAASIPLEARNAAGAMTWSVVSGAVPAGLTLSSSTGVISGPPSAIGSFPFRVRATHGVTVSERDFRIEVWDGAELLPILASADPLCPGQSADLSVAGSYGSYSWLPGGQTSSAISVSPAASTDYGVLLGTVSACRQRAYRRLEVGPLPLFVTAPPRSLHPRRDITRACRITGPERHTPGRSRTGRSRAARGRGRSPSPPALPGP